MKKRDITKELPPAPKKVTEWILKDLVNNTYIIFDKSQKKAVCTRCGAEFTTDGMFLKHNRHAKCPSCGEGGKGKSANVGRKRLTEYFRTTILTRKGKTAYITLSEVIIEFKNFGKPTIYRDITDIYKINQTVTEHWQWEWYRQEYVQIKSFRIPKPSCGINGSCKWRGTYLYEANIKSVLKNTFQYSDMPNIISYLDGINVAAYINYFKKYKSLELLYKAGYTRIFEEKINNNYGSSVMNWNGKTIEKALKLNKSQLKELCKICDRSEISYSIIRCYKILLKENVKPITMISIQEVMHFGTNQLKEIKKIVPLNKWLQYAETQERGYNFTGDYLDYIKECIMLGMDMRKKETLYPKDLRAAHRITSKLYKVQADEIRDAAIKKINEQFTKKLSIENDKYKLIIAQSQEELNRESAKLNHCVKTYGDRMARGDCIIGFIRKKDDLKEPYYTIEFKGKDKLKVVQCRGNLNSSMTDEIEKFVKEIERRIS